MSIGQNRTQTPDVRVPLTNYHTIGQEATTDAGKWTKKALDNRALRPILVGNWSKICTPSDSEDTRQDINPSRKLPGTSTKAERDNAQQAGQFGNKVKDAGQRAISDQPDEPAQSAGRGINDDKPNSNIESDSLLQTRRGRTSFAKASFRWLL